MIDFTFDWFTPTIPRLEPVFPKDAKRILEIGCFEGRSTLWFLEQAPKACVTCVDSFKGGSDLIGIDLTGLKERFLSNVEAYRQRVYLHEGNTWSILCNLSPNSYDFVYVDGSHEECDVIHDALQAFRVVRPGGVVVFDDYGWGTEGQSRPKEAIDYFLRCFGPKTEVLAMNYIVAIKKC
jgi:predicted O-methyltransferase YrrM